MSSLPRTIDIDPFVKSAGELPPIDFGTQPQLQWIDIENLLIDTSYQRDILGTGRRNILRIAREFEWAKFATVIVAPASRNRFTIIDGQHRTHGAALRGIKQVPCQVVPVGGQKQALAFAAINANVTKMSSMQLHAARVAAGDGAAVRLQTICAAGGVRLLRSAHAVKDMKPGDTMAVSQLRQALDRYGEKAFRLALCAITKTGDGNPGMLRGLLILALSSVLEGAPQWRDHPKLIAAFERFDFKQVWADAGGHAGGFSRQGFFSALSDLISAHLIKTLSGTAPAKPSASIAKPAPKPVAAPPAPKPAPAPTPAVAGETTVYNGVAIDVASGKVAYGGRAIVVTSREALLVACLARVFGSPIDRNFLIKRVFAKQRIPTDAEAVINHMAGSLAARLQTLGLEIQTPKVGIALRAAS